MREWIAFSITLALALPAAAEPPPPPPVAPGPNVTRVDLPTLLAKARRSPQALAAQASARSAHAKADEVGNTWIPQFEVTFVGGPSPSITCHPSSEVCVSTNPSNAGTEFNGLFFHLEVKAFMPLYTFGKISAGTDAAESGARAAEALATATANDASLDAGRAYYAVKLGRELSLMLEEGRGNLDDAIGRVEKQLDSGKGDATEADRYRLRSFRAEIEARLSETHKLEGIGLAGVHLFSGVDDADVDVGPLEEAVFDLPSREDARSEAGRSRPERKAAEAGAHAADRLVDVETRKWLPDILAVGEMVVARAGGADDPGSAYANDPYNVTSFSGGVALHWALDPGVRPAKVRGAEADAARAHATAELAAKGLPAEAEKAWAEARDAKDRLQASRKGEKEARAWLVSTIQSTQAGLSDAKDIPDALLAWFNMRARVLQAIFDWNVGVLTLARATGTLK